MKATVLVPVAALIVGGAGGFLAGKSNEPAAGGKTEEVSDSRSARRSTSSSGTSGSETVRRNRVKSLGEALSIPGQNNRLTALMDYYAQLDPSQFEEEAKKLENLPWSERMMVGYLLFARWGEEDPTAAIALSLIHI